MVSLWYVSKDVSEIEKEEISQDPVEASYRMRRRLVLERLNALRARGQSVFQYNRY